MSHLFVTNDFPPKVGGIQNMLWELWRRLPEGRAHILTTTYEGDAAFDAVQHFPIERHGSVLLPTPATRRLIDDTAARVGANLVVLDPAHIVGLLGPSLQRPYALMVHGAELSIPARTPGYSVALRRAMRGARLIIAAGPWVAREAQAIAPDVDVVDIPPGVDVDAFRPSTPDERAAARRRLGVAPDAEVVLHLSRLVPRKGADTLIRAVAQLAPSRPKLVALIAWGRGRDEGRLRRLAEKLHAPVRFVGRVPNGELTTTYGAADVFSHVCRNRWGGLEQEGFGIIFLEAAACGVPQIAGNSGGAGDAVLDGVTGFVIDPATDADAVAARLAELLDNPERRAEMGKAARQRALLDFAYDDLAAKLDVALTKAEQA
ncbi:MAG TPA: glycosyltransferase family 4 protein [Acidimicrobiales bacterium]|nr:glycosyltransferase family 4 protein [Acidimicrobiales bacterium]